MSIDYSYGIDPFVLEVVASLGIDDLIKSVNFDKIIRDAIKSGNFDVVNILQQIMAQVDVKKILENFDWKKMIQEAATGKLKSFPVTVECAIELGKFALADNSSSSLLENPVFKSRHFLVNKNIFQSKEVDFSRFEIETFFASL